MGNFFGKKQEEKIETINANSNADYMRAIKHRDEHINRLSGENKRLINDLLEIEQENAILQNKIDKNEESSLKNRIDRFIENWYENDPDVDIGKIDVPIIGEIDVMPDYLEKKLYKKTLYILMSFLQQSVTGPEEK